LKGGKAQLPTRHLSATPDTIPTPPPPRHRRRTYKLAEFSSKRRLPRALRSCKVRALPALSPRMFDHLKRWAEREAACKRQLAALQTTDDE
jgi:hypothetical protein